MCWWMYYGSPDHDTGRAGRRTLGGEFLSIAICTTSMPIVQRMVKSNNLPIARPTINLIMEPIAALIATSLIAKPRHHPEKRTAPSTHRCAIRPR